MTTDTDHVTDAEIIETAIEKRAAAEVSTPVQVTAEMILDRRAKVVEFMATAMVEGIHNDYAKLPGCGPKPILLQPGADKLRLLLRASCSSERTFFESEGEGRFRIAYRTTATDEWGVTVSKERWAGHSDEGKKFYDQSGNPLPLNTLAARAEKRSYVAAISAFTGVREVFGSGEANALLPEPLRELVPAVYAAMGMERLAKQAASQGSRLKAAQFPGWLGAAVDTAGEKYGWDAARVDEVFKLLGSGSVAVEDVPTIITGEVAA